MDNAAATPPISTYRQLTDAEVIFINRAKALEAKFNGFIDELRTADVDQRNVSIAQTEGETAFMRITRAIAQPNRLTDHAD